MRYIAIETATNKVYSFIGATKLSQFIGISTKTIYRLKGNILTDKEYNGYKIAKCKHNPQGNSKRGDGNIKNYKPDY